MDLSRLRLSRPRMGLELPEKLQFILDEYRYKIAYGGRGGAKSRAYAGGLVLYATRAPSWDPEFILCCREIQNSIEQSVKRLIDDEIKRQKYSNLYDSTKKSILNVRNGSEFIFAGLRDNVDSIKSIPRITKCWVEEAHSLSEFSLTKLIPTIRDKGSEIWMSFNPEDDDDPVYVKFVVNDPPPRSKVVRINYPDNPWFNDTELKEEMEWDKKHDYDKYLHVWEGETRKASAEQIMHGVWRVEETPEPPPSTIFRHGLDFGFGTDPAAAIRCWTEGRKLYIDYEAYGHGVDIDDLPELIENSIPGIKKWPIAADSSRPDSISYLNKPDQGFNVFPAKKGAGSIVDGITFIRSFEVIIHPRCVETIREFRKYSYKVDPKTGKILPLIIDDWNHLIDGLRYALEGETRKETMIDEITAIEAAGQDIPLDDHMFSPIVIGVYMRRFVNDATIITVRQGIKVLWQQRFKGTRANDLATKLLTLNKQLQPRAIFLDEGGFEPSGLAVAQIIRTAGLDNLVTVNLGGEADEDEQYCDKLTELWISMKDWMVNGGDIPEDELLVNSLSIPIVVPDAKKRIRLEKIEDTGKRMLIYPCWANSLAVTFYVTVIDDVAPGQLEPEALPAY